MTYYINVYEMEPGGRQFLGAYSKANIHNKHALYRLRITPKDGCTIKDVVGWKYG
jgi:hypothetical protein